jgi:hypothetical protein
MTEKVMRGSDLVLAGASDTQHHAAYERMGLNDAQMRTVQADLAGRPATASLTVVEDDLAAAFAAVGLTLLRRNTGEGSTFRVHSVIMDADGNDVGVHGYGEVEDLAEAVKGAGLLTAEQARDLLWFWQQDQPMVSAPEPADRGGAAAVDPKPRRRGRPKTVIEE